MRLMERESNLGEEHRRLVTREPSKILDELQNEQQPSAGRIKRWLARAKTVVDVGKLGAEASEIPSFCYMK